MIEEVSELSGDASPLTLAPTAATNSDAANSDADAASAEKPKRRRVTKKTADAELPLDGVEAPEKPKRVTRRKKTDEAAEVAADGSDGDGEVAPAKPKRVTRRKKADETDDATSTSKPETAPVEQSPMSGPAPFQMAPAAAMGSFTPSPTEATTEANNKSASADEGAQALRERGTLRDDNSNADTARPTRSRRSERDNDSEATDAQPTRSRRSERDNSNADDDSNAGNDEQTAPQSSANEAGESNNEAATNDNQNAGDENSDDDDFRGRLSYRDRRAMRREQRIVARTGREETITETDDETRGDRNNRNRNNRDTEVRDTQARDTQVRDTQVRDTDNRGDSRSDRNNNRGDRNDSRGDRNSNRVDRNDSRSDRNNSRADRNDNRADRNDNRPDRNNNRADRNDNRPDRNNNRADRNDNRGEREPRENRRERNGSRAREYDLAQLEAMEGEALMAVVAELNMEEAPGEKEALIYAIIEAQAHAQNAILKKGILDILPDGKGFLRTENYYPSEGDVYVSQTQIKRFGLKTGDEVLGTARVPKENERYHGLLRVESINGLSIETSKLRLNFDKLTPIFPTERFPLETDASNITARIIDLISPIGKGQRGLIVAPPKAGKTTLIKNIANSITENNPEVMLFVLLIDERPEEVTDISRSVRGEVVASTFDEVPENHIRVADIVMERAKRLVEMGNDVVVLMDSITRLSRASNLVVAPSGRTMSGGLDPAAMYKPKRHFGAARNIENGGSLTVLATVLVDTGSRMDEYIFEELKGTGNLDLVLDRDLFNQRIFPAIDINRSGTRRDDLLLNPEELAATFHLRRTLAALDNDKAVTLLIDRLKNTKSNANFMEVVAKSARNSPA